MAHVSSLFGVLGVVFLLVALYRLVGAHVLMVPRVSSVALCFSACLPVCSTVVACVAILSGVLPVAPWCVLLGPDVVANGSRCCP